MSWRYKDFCDFVVYALQVAIFLRTCEEMSVGLFGINTKSAFHRQFFITYFFSKVSSMFVENITAHHGSVWRVQNKECYFLVVLSKKWFLPFSLLFLMQYQIFHQSINQLETRIAGKNCQWNCMQVWWWEYCIFKSGDRLIEKLKSLKMHVL